MYDKVVFDRDLLITHMVSPEGEQLQLIEPIDPKGQNVEAWMLELEGNMRLTVSNIDRFPTLSLTSPYIPVMG